MVGYESRPSTIHLEPDAFGRYLREEGLERIIDERASRGEWTRPGRERFSRSVKALIRVGGASGTGHDRAIGLRLELVVERDPFSPGEAALPVRLLYSEAPLGGALVVAMRKETGAAGSAAIVARVRTDSDGRAVLPTGPGVWLIKAVHMVRATEAGADWESTWTSLSCARQAR